MSAAAPLDVWVPTAADVLCTSSIPSTSCTLAPIACSSAAGCPVFLSGLGAGHFLFGCVPWERDQAIRKCFCQIAILFIHVFGTGLDLFALTLGRLCFGCLSLFFLLQHFLLQCFVIISHIVCDNRHLSPPCRLLFLCRFQRLLLLSCPLLLLISSRFLLQCNVAIVLVHFLAPLLKYWFCLVVECFHLCTPVCLRTLVQRLIGGHVAHLRRLALGHDHVGSAPLQV